MTRPFLYALALLPVLVAIKAYLFWYYSSNGRDDIILAATDAGLWLLVGPDILLCACLGLAYSTLGYLLGDRRVVFYSAFAVNVFVVCYSLLNITIIRQYGNHLSPLHLKFVGKLSVFAGSVVSFLDPWKLVGLAALLIALYFFMRSIRKLASPSRVLAVAVPLSVVLVALGWTWLSYGAFKGVYVGGMKRNSVLHFAQDAAKVALFHKPRAAANTTAVNEHMFSIKSQVLHKPVNSLAPPVATLPTFNRFVVIILESTGYQAIQPETTPFLHALRRRSISFQNHFTTSQASLLSNQSIFYSNYTGPNFFQDNSPIANRSLMETMADRGLKTAVFQSGYFAYDGIDKLWRNKGVEHLVDGTIVMEQSDRNGWAWGALEEDTVAQVKEFLDQQQASGGFAMVYRPVFPHHPYYTPMKDKPFEDKTWPGKYANSLFYTDRHIKAIVEHLELRGMDDDTVVVVVSDHGETVTPDLAGHGLQFSADELQVAFDVMIPNTTPQAVQLFTSHLDVAPTLATLAGAEHSSGWLGRNLLVEKVQPLRSFVVPSASGVAGIIDNGYAYKLDPNHKGVQSFRIERGEFHPVAETMTPTATISVELNAFSSLGLEARLDEFFVK